MTDLERVEHAVDVALAEWDLRPILAHPPGGGVAEYVARAVLVGLMEPSEGMIEAGVTAELDGTLGSRVTNSWQAMFRHILEDGE